MVEIYVIPFGCWTMYIVQMSPTSALSVFVHRDGLVGVRLH